MECCLTNCTFSSLFQTELKPPPNNTCPVAPECVSPANCGDPLPGFCPSCNNGTCTKPEDNKKCNGSNSCCAIPNDNSNTFNCNNGCGSNQRCISAGNRTCDDGTGTNCNFDDINLEIECLFSNYSRPFNSFPCPGGIRDCLFYVQNKQLSCPQCVAGQCSEVTTCPGNRDCCTTTENGSALECSTSCGSGRKCFNKGTRTCGNASGNGASQCEDERVSTNLTAFQNCVFGPATPAPTPAP